MTNDITELRAVLFDALRGLNDKENPMDINRAKAIADVGQTVINTAKVEIEYIKATKRGGTDFVPPALPDGSDVSPTQTGTKTTTAVPGGRHITHKMD